MLTAIQPDKENRVKTMKSPTIAMCFAMFLFSLKENWKRGPSFRPSLLRSRFCHVTQRSPQKKLFGGAMPRPEHVLHGEGGKLGKYERATVNPQKLEPGNQRSTRTKEPENHEPIELENQRTTRTREPRTKRTREPENQRTTRTREPENHEN